MAPLPLRKGVSELKKKDTRRISQILMICSLLGVILAGFGATGVDIWLASTQWLLIAVVLAGFGIYLRMES
jgi:arginine exporter protein ArgO